MHVDLFFDQYFDFLNVKTKAIENELNSINVDRSEAIKRQITDT